jgi:hypothetical protein
MPEAHHASAGPLHILGGNHVGTAVYTACPGIKLLNRWGTRLMCFLQQSQELVQWDSSKELEVASSQERHTFPCGHFPVLLLTRLAAVVRCLALSTGELGPAWSTVGAVFVVGVDLFWFVHCGFVVW